MDPERARTQADLRGILAGDVDCDDTISQLYASDASIYEIRPLGVVRPRRTSDVIACAQYATEHGVPLHARGAGTGLAGDSLGRGLVLDFSRYMRRILSVEPDRVTVQPGVVHWQLNEHLRRRQRLFGPDPAVREVSTLGGVLGVNGSGSRWIKYGSAGDKILEMQVVLADGSLLQLGQHDVHKARQDRSDSRLSRLVRQVADVLERNAELIAEHWPASRVNRSGYHLPSILRDGKLDLARLMVGSEGTLGLVTEATVRTDRLPRFTGVALLFFDRLDAAARAALEAPRLGATACDLLDRRLLVMARESDVRFDVLVPQAAEAMLLVEAQGDDAAVVSDMLKQIVHVAVRRRKLAFDSRTALADDEVELFWRLANRMAPMLYRLKGSTRPLPFVEDVSVPPETLAEFLVRLQNVLKKHQVTASLFGHAGHGQLHIRPFLDLADPADIAKIEPLAADLYAEVLNVRGSISGEHGDGLSRTWFVERQYGPLVDAFAEIKRAFDPDNLLNPGKKVAAEPPRPSEQLRPVELTARTIDGGAGASGVAGDGPPPPVTPADPGEPAPIALQLSWTGPEAAAVPVRSPRGGLAAGQGESHAGRVHRPFAA